MTVNEGIQYIFNYLKAFALEIQKNLNELYIEDIKSEIKPYLIILCLIIVIIIVAIIYFFVVLYIANESDKKAKKEIAERNN